MFFMLFFTFRLYPARWIAGRFWNVRLTPLIYAVCFFLFVFFNQGMKLNFIAFCVSNTVSLFQI